MTRSMGPRPPEGVWNLRLGQELAVNLGLRLRHASGGRAEELAHGAPTGRQRHMRGAKAEELASDPEREGSRTRDGNDRAEPRLEEG